MYLQRVAFVRRYFDVTVESSAEALREVASNVPIFWVYPLHGPRSDAGGVSTSES